VRISEAGDSALLLELDEVINVSVNAQAIAVAGAVRGAGLPGIRDVVSTYRSVAVHFDPLTLDIETLHNTLARAADTPPVIEEGKTVVIPVQYGGDMGPDLRAVAAFAGISPDEVVARHASARYRVFMLGFLPGFTYMGTVDESIAMPRHATPRLKVPTGSVGIAGRQTGVYPRESPGGWQLIGRTPVSLFNPSRVPAALVAPGDTVRFVRDKISAPIASGFSRTSVVSGFSRTITVLRPGLFTTIQDTGRWGHQAIGVPVSGPMDRLSHRVANALVGNEPAAALLEATLAGPEIRIENAAVIAVTGADFSARLDADDIPLHRPIKCRPGAVLRFGERRSGAGRTSRLPVASLRHPCSAVARHTPTADSVDSTVGRSRPAIVFHSVRSARRAPLALSALQRRTSVVRRCASYLAHSSTSFRQRRSTFSSARALPSRRSPIEWDTV